MKGVSNMLGEQISDRIAHFIPTLSMPILDEAVGERKIYYRLGESKMFEYANQNTTISGEKLVNIIPKMVMPDSGFIQLNYNNFNDAIKYEIFDSMRFRIEGKAAIRKMIELGQMVPVYSEEYNIPVSIPYIIQASKANTKVFVNITPFVTMDSYGKVEVRRTTSYNGLMAIFVSAAMAQVIASTGLKLPADVNDPIILTYASMLERVINSVVHMDPISRDKVRYLAAKFALIQMYGTSEGEQMFYRISGKYFPKLSKMITDVLDDQFHLDCYDTLPAFIDELVRLNHSMRGLTAYNIYDKWIRTYGASTAMSIDYLGYHLYTICMILFESPLISRTALEPIMEKNRGNDLYRRIPEIIKNR